MTEKMKVVSIKIKTKNGTPIELTMEEARDLYEHFHELFGKKDAPSYPVPVVYPWYIPPYRYDKDWNTPWTASDGTACYTDKTSLGTMVRYFCKG